MLPSGSRTEKSRLPYSCSLERADDLGPGGDRARVDRVRLGW